jgi:hypothetical protein
MSKIIYLNETIKYIALINPTYAQELIKSGKVKETKTNAPYLVIELNDQNEN